jgi:hypothetical protein
MAGGLRERAASVLSGFAPYATGLNLLKVYDSVTHLQMFFDSVARADRISWLHSKLG